MSSTDLELHAGTAIETLESDDFAARVGALLPDTLPLPRFIGVAKTAIRSKPELAAPDIDKRSLFNALIACAQMGVVPDGKQAALNVYNTKEKQDGKDVWVKKVQLLPMVAGVRDVAADYGWMIRAEVIYSGDEYEIVDEPPAISHKRARPGVDRGDLVAAYAIATKDGVRYQVVLYDDDIAKRRAKAKTDNIWKEWPEAMWRKSAIHALFRILPKSEVDRMDRLHRLGDSEDIEPDQAAELLYGPDGATFKALEQAPADHPSDGDGPPAAAAEEASCMDGGTPQQAAAGSPSPETAAVPGDDDEPEPQPAWVAASQTVVEGGNWAGKTIAEVAAVEAGKEWIGWALARPAKFDPNFYEALATYVEGALPELWAAHTERSAA